ncbi:hypothetical protein [Elizabethkingia occulta]|uniref:DUF2007 domain-containing protein n=1 Tax=Elizabethkingia occulta TaxID=1867263 RepID=A0A1T3MUV8_9FLAO|nr:hypothetical protein [Elizabethkingia occulta]OPB95259.1 hypothetical protein BB020_19220 [Elizabethkingia occulta]OPC68367.1 hypothetical protein BAZ10_14495 [Elizabethkingia occulta]
MPAEKSLKKIFQYEYLVNAEYLKDILQENKISAIIDYENKSLLVKDSDFNKAILIINEENIDESKTIDQENFMEEYDEWNKNNLNPGHYLGGHIPFFYKTKSNHLKFAIITFINLIIQIVLLFITTSIDLWNILFLIVTIIIEINFINSWVNYKSEKRKTQ